MIIMTIKMIIEVIRKNKSNQIKPKEKNKTQQQKPKKKNHTLKKERKYKTKSIVYTITSKSNKNNGNKTKEQKNQYSETKMERRYAKGRVNSQNLILIFQKYHRCANSFTELRIQMQLSHG